MRIAVIGGGVVGVTIAHALLDLEHDVVMIDRKAVAAETSRGNAGWIAHVDIMPLASAKSWGNVPKWLLDPMGPLSVRPTYMPTLAPWMARFIAASTPAKVDAGVQAIAALNGASLAAWEKLLDKHGMARHLKRLGQLSVWKDAPTFNAARPVIEKQRGFGVPVEILNAQAIQKLEPALSNIVGGAWYPTMVSVADPRVLTEMLASHALNRKMVLLKHEVTAIEPQEAGVQISTADGKKAVFDRVIVAAGAWSKPLAAGLGDAVPLETERGYNITFPPGTLGLTRPIAYEGQGFVTTPLDTGDRVGGAVEFAGLEAPPNYARIDAFLKRLSPYLPALNIQTQGARWMGHRPSIPDSLPVISPASRDSRVIYAFGHGHYGLTQSAVTAQAVAALVSGEKPPIDLTPYAVTRF
jgi:D-amino-acid dehydrogenase